MTSKRTLTYVAIALIVGAALALAVALSRSESEASVGSGYAGQSAATVAGTYATEGDDLSAVDPATEEPVLDMFTSKDPFIPLDVASTSGTSGTTDTTATDTSDASRSAKIKVNGTAYTVSKGDKVPSGTPVFMISAISSEDVTFDLIDAEFSDGSNSVTVKVGEPVRVKDDDSGKIYRLSVTSISDGSTITASSSTSEHSISLLSVTSQSDTPLATFEVDDKTYSDKAVGDTFSTGWGEIKVLAISVSAQTATIMHGDQTITLRAGQVVVK